QWEFVDMLASGRLIDLPDPQNFATGVVLDGQKFDDMYQLGDEQETVVTSLTDPRSGRRVTQHFSRRDFPNLVIYTPGHREAICMEPYSCAADPFRLEQAGIPSGLRVLAAGESAKTQIRLAAQEG